MTRLRLEAAECFERDVRTRLPFRFGAAPKGRIAPAHPEKS